MLRILSDLHFRDASSRLTALDQLVPVLSGVSSLWLNGDTCDNQTGMSSAQLAEIKTFFQGQVPAVRFITGNHDPDISDTHHGSAADGRLFATHGDVFLDEIVPWSRVRQTLHTRVQQAQWDHPHHDSESLDGRLALNRIACVGFARECDPERTDFGHRFSRLVTEFFPPRQPWAMLQAWRTIADRVAARKPDWFPSAQVVVTGHVHFPKIWSRGPLTVINTGAFSGPLGALCVDLIDETVVVRRLRRIRRELHPGAALATIPLAPVRSSP